MLRHRFRFSFLETCPLNNRCLDKCVVYKATVTQTLTNKEDTYIGLTENTFKTRYTQHKSSFNLQHRRKSTTLSEHIWSLKERHIDHTIRWAIINKLKTLPPQSRACQLCLAEKIAILRYKPSLNKKTEIFNTCMHQKTPQVNTSSGQASLRQADVDHSSEDA